MNINQIAFCTIPALAVATIGLTVYAATATTTVATVAYAIFAALGSALTIASMTVYTIIYPLGRFTPEEAYVSITIFRAMSEVLNE